MEKEKSKIYIFKMIFATEFMPIVKVGTIYLYPIFLNLIHEKKQCYLKYFFVVFTSQDEQIYFIFYGFFFTAGLFRI